MKPRNLQKKRAGDSDDEEFEIDMGGKSSLFTAAKKTSYAEMQARSRLAQKPKETTQANIIHIEVNAENENILFPSKPDEECEEPKEEAQVNLKEAASGDEVGNYGSQKTETKDKEMEDNNEPKQDDDISLSEADIE